MEKQHKKYIESTRSYKSLLIFILGFQTVVSTGWIVFSNYEEYVSDNSTENLISLATSIAGILIVLLVWVLLDGSFRTSFRKFAEIIKEKSAFQKEINENNNELKLLEEGLDEATGENDFYDLAEYFTEQSSSLLKVAHTSIWLLNKSMDSLKCFDIYHANSFQHEKHDNLTQRDFPNFFKALLSVKIIEADQIHRHPVLADLEEEYFNKHNSVAAFASVILHNGQPIGVCLFEHEGIERKWTDSELTLGRLIAQTMALSYREHDFLKVKTNLSVEFEKLQNFFHNLDSAIAKFVVKDPFPTTDIRSEQIDALLSSSVIHTYNDSFLALLGITQDDIVTKMSPLKHFIKSGNPPEVVDEFIENGYSLVKKEISFEKEGREIIIINSLIGVVENRLVKEVWMVGTDITDVKKRERFYDSINAKSTKPVLVIGQEGEVVYENEATKNTFNGLATISDFLNYIHTDDRDKIGSAIDEIKIDKKNKLCPSIQYRFSEGRGWSLADTSISFLEMKNTGYEGVIIEITDISEREKQIGELNTQIESLLQLNDNLPTPISVIDREGIILYENHAVEAEFGYSKNARVGRHCFDFIHSDQLTSFQSHFQNATNDSTYRGKELIRFLNADGQWEKAEVSINSLIGNKGDVDFAVVMSMNKVSDEVSQEKGSYWKAENKFYDQVLQKANRVYVLTDANGKITFVNNASKTQLGFEAEEMLGKSLLDFVPSTEKLALLRNMQYLEADHSAHLNLDLQFKHKKGEWAKVDAFCSSVTNDGKFSGLLFQIDDVTVKRQQEKDLSFRANFYQALVKSVSSALVFVDEKGTIKYVNDAVMVLFGYQPKDSFLKWVHSKHHEELKNMLSDANAHHKHGDEMSLKIMDQDGNWKKVKVLVTNASKTSSYKGFIFEIKSIDGKTIGHKAKVSNTEVALFQTIKNTPDHLFVMLDEKGNFTYLEGDTKRHLGLSKEDAFNTPFRDLLDDMSAVVYDLVALKLSKGKDQVIRKEIKINTPDKKGKWLYASFSFVKKDNSIAMVGQNITNLKQSFASMEKDSLYVKWLLDNSTEAVLLCNKSGKIFYQNSTAKQLFSKEVSSLDQFPALFHKDYIDIVDRVFTKATQSERAEVAQDVVKLVQDGKEGFFTMRIINLLEVHGMDALRIGLTPSQVPEQEIVIDQQKDDQNISQQNIEQEIAPSEIAEAVTPTHSNGIANEEEKEALPKEQSEEQNVEVLNPSLAYEQKGGFSNLKILILNGAPANEITKALKLALEFKEESIQELIGEDIATYPTPNTAMKELEEIANGVEEDLELLNLNELLEALLLLYRTDFRGSNSVKTDFTFDGWVFADKVALFLIFAPIIQTLAKRISDAGEVVWKLDRNEQEMTISVTGTPISTINEVFQNDITESSALGISKSYLDKYNGKLLLVDQEALGLSLNIILPRNFRVS